MMKYIDCEAPCDAIDLRLRECEKPKLGADQVLIEVAAAGVNRADILQRQGKYPPPENANPVMGLEVSGIVRSVGHNVRHLKVSDRVCALTDGGGYAEFVAVPEGQCLPMPAHMDFVTAAALPESLFTVWTNVFERGFLQPGESFLVHGGAGAIGSIAIQMARVAGARVYATAGSPEKCALCEKLGALRAINYQKEDFVKVIKQITGRGADLILDIVGGDYIQKNISAAAMDGRIVNIAYQEGAVSEVNFLPVMLKRLMMTGSTLRSREGYDKANIGYQLLRGKWSAVAEGRISPIVHSIFDLEEVSQAHILLEQHSVVGKIVIHVNRFLR